MIYSLILSGFILGYMFQISQTTISVAGLTLNADNVFIFLFAFTVFCLSFYVLALLSFKFIESTLSYFPNIKKLLAFFYKDIPLIVFGAFALIFEMFNFVNSITEKLFQLRKKSNTSSKADTATTGAAQKAALDLLLDDEDEDIEMVQVQSVNQKINDHNKDNIESLRRVVSGFSDIKHYKFENTNISDTQYLKIYLSPKDIELDQNFEIFSTFIQQWPKTGKQRLIMTDFPTLKEPSFMDVVEGKVNLSRVVRKNLAPNTDVLAKTSITNSVSEKKLFSLVSLLKDQYDEIVVLVPDGQESNWKTAYNIFNSDGFIKSHGRTR